jgi:hypothetical protein
MPHSFEEKPSLAKRPNLTSFGLLRFETPFTYLLLTEKRIARDYSQLEN